MRSVKVNTPIMRAEMARYRLTIAALHRTTGLTAATLSAVRNGKTCSMATAEKIAAALKISTQELLLEEA